MCVTDVLDIDDRFLITEPFRYVGFVFKVWFYYFFSIVCTHV